MEPPQISYEDLAVLEDEFNDIDLEMTRRQYELSKSAYARRADTVAKIPNFWPLVLEQAPTEIDQQIHAHDSKLISEHLTGVRVTRPELDEHGAGGDPRSICIALDFSANDVFSDKILQKNFWYRRSDDWTGLVSEPVKIHWKKGKDPTEGLTDGAVALFEARKKAGNVKAKDLPEYGVLAKKVEHWNGANTSFFTWFGYVSGRRYVAAEESRLATEKHQRRKEARKRGEQIETPEVDEDPDAEDAEDDSAVEVHESGEELAYAFTEDLWPNAIKYFTQAQELGDLSDPEFEEEESDNEHEGDDQPIDIRSLVQSSGGKVRTRDSSGPPAKKSKR